jgi:hypothetical protein
LQVSVYTGLMKTDTVLLPTVQPVLIIDHAGGSTTAVHQSRTLTQLRPFFFATNNAMSARLTIEP